ncbi:hypothetical protein CGLO_00517 [Colletotrichum gloeosporioides Cg-14]|uniref:Uncharacterized protein n=1 Tax=Colletotrichum gloeosporioides (strain Cg-14) TaxID=1237896 RepID=T0KUE0_COLGC|nr:hypothetical protein CGLO_00517 [Colletotrichum gloeosporioides Cg-14]
MKYSTTTFVNPNPTYSNEAISPNPPKDPQDPIFTS